MSMHTIAVEDTIQEHVSWGAPRSCAECGTVFAPISRHQRFCSSVCRYKAFDHGRRLDPARGRRMRERCREWAAEHRAVRHAQPWLRGAPPYGRHLPGGGCTVDADPPIVLELNKARLLHGALTAIIGGHAGQAQRRPDWALVPWPTGIGWSVYAWSAEVLAALAGRTVRCQLGHRIVVLRFGPAARVRAPAIQWRGRRSVRVDTLTPVVITKEHRSIEYTAPTAETIASSLVNTLAPRLGLSIDLADVCLRLVERQSEPVSVWAGETQGRIRGWHGMATLEANAVAAWLLEAAARGPGLGGRTAFGFGRVRVEVRPRVGYQSGSDSSASSASSARSTSAASRTRSPRARSGAPSNGVTSTASTSSTVPPSGGAPLPSR